MMYVVTTHGKTCAFNFLRNTRTTQMVINSEQCSLLHRIYGNELTEACIDTL